MRTAKKTARTPLNRVDPVRGVPVVTDAQRAADRAAFREDAAVLMQNLRVLAPMVTPGDIRFFREMIGTFGGAR